MAGVQGEHVRLIGEVLHHSHDAGDPCRALAELGHRPADCVEQLAQRGERYRPLDPADVGETAARIGRRGVVARPGDEEVAGIAGAPRGGARGDHRRVLPRAVVEQDVARRDLQLHVFGHPRLRNRGLDHLCDRAPVVPGAQHAARRSAAAGGDGQRKGKSARTADDPLAGESAVESGAKPGAAGIRRRGQVRAAGAHRPSREIEQLRPRPPPAPGSPPRGNDCSDRGPAGRGTRRRSADRRPTRAAHCRARADRGSRIAPAPRGSARGRAAPRPAACASPARRAR